MARMARYLSNQEIVELLKDRTGMDYGAHVLWARKHGVNQATLSLVLGGKRDVPQSIAEALGYTKTVVYIKAQKED